MFLDRNVAWLFYSIVFYYHDDDIWYREIARKLLKLQSYEIEQLKNNYQNDIIEIKYKILRRWKQRQVGHLRKMTLSYPVFMPNYRGL